MCFLKNSSCIDMKGNQNTDNILVSAHHIPQFLSYLKIISSNCHQFFLTGNRKIITMILLFFWLHGWLRILLVNLYISEKRREMSHIQFSVWWLPVDIWWWRCWGPGWAVIGRPGRVLTGALVSHHRAVHGERWCGKMLWTFENTN